MQQLALFAFVTFIGTLMVRDMRRRPSVSAVSWFVVLWAVIFASRPVSEWTTSKPVAMTPDAYFEGSPTDRLVYLLLIAIGFIVLFLRRNKAEGSWRRNFWLWAFYAFWAVSVLWSDFPFVAFKRLFKDFGSVVMALVILTESDPVDAAKAVLVRTAYLLVPLSVLFIRYYPELGRAYTGYTQNELMYIGVATHKNTLGALLLVSSIALLWDLVTFDRERAKQWLPRADGIVVLAMCLYLLRIANSATAIACTVIGVSLFLLLRLKIVQRNIRFMEVYTVCAVGIWFALDKLVGITEFVVNSLGRDMTLTTRTDAWSFVLSQDINPVLGAGFKSFWAGDRMARVWVEFPGIVQAHNGYVETYLEGGLLGLFFLGALLLSASLKVKRGVAAGDAFASVRLSFLFIALFYNFSEASFSQLSLLWFVTQLILLDSPTAQSAPPIAHRAVVPITVDSHLRRQFPSRDISHVRNEYEPGHRARPVGRRGAAH